MFIGGSEDLSGRTWPAIYLCKLIPFDVFLFASRAMFAKVARASSPVKDLIVAVPGVIDVHWENTYGK